MKNFEIKIVVINDQIVEIKKFESKKLRKRVITAKPKSNCKPIKAA